MSHNIYIIVLYKIVRFLCVFTTSSLHLQRKFTLFFSNQHIINTLSTLKTLLYSRFPKLSTILSTIKSYS